MKKLALLIVLLLSVNIYADDLYDIEENVKYLASPELKGRKPGTEGIEKAASFIEDKFKKYGLKGINGQYRQEFEITTGKQLTSSNEISFNVIVPKPGVPIEKVKPITKKWEVEKDYLPFGFSSNGVAEGEMVFCGYGITAKDLNYDDYDGVDVEGKIVVLLSDSPDGESKSGDFTKYSNHRYKISNAKTHKVAGIIFVNIQGDSANVFHKLEDDASSSDAGIIAVIANRVQMDKFFPNSSKLFPSESEINSTKKPKSFIIPNATCKISVNLENKTEKTHNVFGVLEGKSDSYIVIGGHYDHLGEGHSSSSRHKGGGDAIHYGADDNASGTSAVIQLAKRFSENKIKDNILFVAFSAEEMGLLGSKDFVKNLPIDKSKIKFYVNYDMVGRLENKELQVFGVGTSSKFESVLDAKATENDIKIKKIATGNGPSDHQSFNIEKIPVLFFFSGIHSEYHTPEDTPEKIDFKGIIKILNYSESVIRNLSNEKKLDYVEVKDSEKREKITRTTSNVVMGVIPSYSDTEHGFVLDGVKMGSPAEIGGLKQGDIIIAVDESEIKDIYDFMYSYWDKKPGDIVKVKVLRGGKKEPLTFNIKLEAK
jgi:hypothetical protein